MIHFDTNYLNHEFIKCSRQVVSFHNGDRYEYADEFYTCKICNVEVSLDYNGMRSNKIYIHRTYNDIVLSCNEHIIKSIIE